MRAMNEHLIQLSYFTAAVLFILSLRWLNHPRTARRGVAAGVAGMAAAIVGTLLAPEIVDYKWIAGGAGGRARASAIPLSRVRADGGAAADGAVARVRRSRRRPGRDGEVHHLAGARRADDVPRVGDRRWRSSSGS